MGSKNTLAFRTSGLCSWLYQFRHLFRLEKNDRAEPTAVLIPARQNIAGTSHFRGNVGEGLSLVLLVNLLSSVKAILDNLSLICQKAKMYA